ncbi:MAG: lysophospholipid acyltransferase family protein [Anaerolineae bacterium]|jgi:1-acyl-sn-glycerol-3-phosphate acyltransferase
MTNDRGGVRCQATTQGGERCKNWAVEGSPYCHVHQAVAVEPPPEQASDEQLRRQLLSELDRLVTRLRALTPDYRPPTFSPQRLVELVEQSLEELPGEVQLGIVERLRQAIDQGWFEPETWKGMWYMLNYTLQYNAGLVKHRFTGDYEADPWGLDWEFLDLVRPILTFFYKAYWRVEATGLDHIPVEGPVLLAANHSGQIPWDAAMLATATLTEHQAQRLARVLYPAWVPKTPFLSVWLARMGQALATVENGSQLLEQGELVATFPEGDEGLSKTFRNRYRLARFDPGFVQMALSQEAPIIPVSIVGAEETYVTLGHVPMLSRMTNLPHLPITLTFPWLGLLGLLPLPSKWFIDFGEPIPTADFGPDEQTNLVLVAQLADRVRHAIQTLLDDRLVRRRSVLFG